MAPRKPSAIMLSIRDGQRELVAARCPVCARAGVRLGMTMAHARALAPPDVHVEAHDPVRDERALKRLAVWATRLAPRVAPDPPDGLLMDVSGCAAMYGGEERLIEAVRDAVHGLDLPHRLALAPTFASAWGLARHGASNGVIVHEGEVRDALASLPIEALRLENNIIVAMRDVGIETVGDVCALPRTTVPARFGASVLLRLDQVFGSAMESIVPVRPAPPVRAERAFDGPTDRLEAITLTVRDLLDMLCGELLRRQSGTRRLLVTLYRSDLPPEKLTARLSRPSRDAAHLWSLIEPKIESAHLGFGVEGVRLTAGSVARIAHEQRTQWTERARSEASAELGALIDTLASRVGEECVLRISAHESHLPERAFVLTRADEAHRPPDSAALPEAPRPSRLFDRPRPIDAALMTPEGPLMILRGRDGSQRVRLSIGPERIGAEWWRCDEPERDYYRAQLEEGRWLWVYRRRGDGRWFLHGEWA